MKQRDEAAPFFSWIHLYDAHRPYDPPEPFKSQYRNEPWGSYDGEVAYVDALMGDLMSWLEDEGLMETTIVAFVADHGESLGDHEELTHGFFVYDATMRVPFIVRTPYDALRARRIRAQVRTIDLMPTLLGYLGGERSRSRDPSQPLADPKDKIGLFKLIREASNDSGEGRRQEAVAKLQQVIEQDPAITEAYNILGNVHAALGEREKAVAAYREALAFDPRYKPAIFSLALSFKEMGRLDEAAAGFKRILELDPRANQASFLLADIEIDRGRFDEVHAIVERVRATNNRERAMLHHLEARRHLGRDEGDAAESELRRAIELDPKLPDAHYDLGLVLEGRGDAAGAQEAYEREITIAPESYQAHFTLAKLLGLGGRNTEMIDHLEKAIAANPDFAVGHLYLANVYLEEGNLERAMTSAQRGIALGPEPSLAPFGHFILADVFHRLGRAREAEREMALAKKLQGS